MLQTATIYGVFAVSPSTMHFFCIISIKPHNRYAVPPSFSQCKNGEQGTEVTLLAHSHILGRWCITNSHPSSQTLEHEFLTTTAHYYISGMFSTLSHVFHLRLLELLRNSQMGSYST